MVPFFFPPWKTNGGIYTTCGFLSQARDGPSLSAGVEEDTEGIELATGDASKRTMVVIRKQTEKRPLAWTPGEAYLPRDPTHVHPFEPGNGGKISPGLDRDQDV